MDGMYSGYPYEGAGELLYEEDIGCRVGASELEE